MEEIEVIQVGGMFGVGDHPLIRPTLVRVILLHTKKTSSLSGEGSIFYIGFNIVLDFRLCSPSGVFQVRMNCRDFP
jgi:hypothetical protein